ncbi:MAG: helix-turn-helix transcriptional regulator [Muribaculaceae bacterium]|nr:helix-turn-helix transcriptional regulator [Muribaculaceae bacterium]
MKSKAVQFLEAHQSGEQATLTADARGRQEHASWLKRSRNVALAIIDFMQENHLSRNDIAERLGVTPQYVSRILSGKVNFSFKSIAEIEKRLGVDCFRAAARV